MHEDGLLFDVRHHYRRAAPLTGFGPGLLDQIEACNAVYRTRFPVRDDDGSVPNERPPAWG